MLRNTLCLLLLLLGQTTQSGCVKKFASVKPLSPTVTARYSDIDIILTAIKSQEGIRLKSYFDTNHYAIGWGTSSKENAYLDLEEADRRLLKAFNRKRKYIEKNFPALTDWHKLVLAMTKYNVSNFGEILRKAIAAKDSSKIAEALQLYIKDANGKTLRGLKRRRLLEGNLIQSTSCQRQEIADSLKKIVALKIKRLK